MNQPTKNDLRLKIIDLQFENRYLKDILKKLDGLMDIHFQEQKEIFLKLSNLLYKSGDS